MLLLGHRGASRYALENTMVAFELALEHGCHGFEFDVRLTADRRLIVCHDARLGGRQIDRSCYDQLAAGMPCLPEVLEKFTDRAFLDIELKVSGLESEVAALLREWPPQRGCIVSSYLPQVIERMYAADKSLPLGLICKSPRQLAAWTSLKIDALFLERGLITPGVVEALHAAGKRIHVWTVNREREMRQFAELNVDGLVSDDTRLLGRTLAPSNDELGREAAQS